MAWTERYVRADADGTGNGTTDANSGVNGAWTLAQAITNAAAGQRLNVKTGTYAYTTTAMTFANDGTTTAQILWRGFSTTPGDLDDDPQTGTRPSFTTTTGQISFSTLAYNMFQNIIFSSSGNDIACLGSNDLMFLRCSFICSWSNSGGYAFGTGNLVNVVFVGCAFEATTTATACVNHTGSQNGHARFVGCVLTGGTSCYNTAVSVGNVLFSRCLFESPSTYGIRVTTDTGVFLTVVDSTFYNCGTACISFDSTQTLPIVMVNNAFVSSGGGFDFGASELVLAVNSLYYNLTSGLNLGTGDIVSIDEISDSSQPLENPPTDMTLKSTSTGAGEGFPQPFTGETYYNYSDIGAVQRLAGVGGGMLVHPGMTGGMRG